MHRTAALLLVATLLGAGCTAPADDDGGEGPEDREGEIQAPWWPVGAYWDVVFTGGRHLPTGTVRLVNFWNDTETSHFWLGVANRQQAIDFAVFDNNPLMGRIHHGLLTPHEKGIHAHGMYTFPTKAGDRFDGLMFGRTWKIEARNGTQPDTLRFSGTATDGAKIEYDYDPTKMWFTFIEIRHANNTLDMRVDVRGHGTGATDVYYFMRSRLRELSPGHLNGYEATNPSGTRDDRFTISAEDPPGLRLAGVWIDGEVQGALRFELLDPSGQSRFSKTLAVEPVHDSVEFVQPVAPGEWTARYVGSGTFEGTIKVIPIVEYTRGI